MRGAFSNHEQNGKSVAAAYFCMAMLSTWKPRWEIRNGALAIFFAKLVLSSTRVLINAMFARKIRVEYEENGQRNPCPMKWLESFSMRNFTNASVFDDTLPVADGLMEIGTHVPIDELKTAMEDWFRRKSYLPKSGELVVSSVPSQNATANSK